MQMRRHKASKMNALQLVSLFKNLFLFALSSREQSDIFKRENNRAIWFNFQSNREKSLQKFRESSILLSPRNTSDLKECLLDFIYATVNKKARVSRIKHRMPTLCFTLNSNEADRESGKWSGKYFDDLSY